MAPAATVLPDDFSPGSTKMTLVPTNFDTAYESVSDMLKVGRVFRRWLGLMLYFLVAICTYIIDSL